MRVVVASALAGCAACFAQAGFIPLAPIVVPPTLVGYLLSLQGGCSCVALLLVGPLVDHVGSEVVLRWGMVLQLLAIGLTAVSKDLTVQVLARIAQGIAGSTIFNSAVSFVMDNFQEPARTKHIGTVLGACMIGGLVGTPAISFTYVAVEGSRYRLVWAFLPAAALQLLAFASLLFAWPPPSSKTLSLGDLLLESPAVSAGCCRKLFGVYATVGSQAWLLAGLLCCCFWAAGAIQTASVLELHARGVSTTTVAIVFMPNLLEFAQCKRLPLLGQGIWRTPRTGEGSCSWLAPYFWRRVSSAWHSCPSTSSLPPWPLSSPPPWPTPSSTRRRFL